MGFFLPPDLIMISNLKIKLKNNFPLIFKKIINKNYFLYILLCYYYIFYFPKNKKMSFLLKVDLININPESIKNYIINKIL